MITLEITGVCDTCGQIVACGETFKHWREAMDSMEASARARGHQVGISRITCKECLEKSRSENTTTI